MRRTTATALLLIFAVSARGDEAGLASQLASKSPDLRERAAERLGEQGDKAAVKALIPLLKDKDWGVRLAAIRALAPIRSTSGQEALIKQLHTGALSILRLETAQLLRKHGDAALLADVVKGLGRTKDEKRVRVIEALGILGPLSTAVAVAALGKQMRVADPQYRIAAARAMGELGKGQKALIGGLKDKEDEVRWLCAVGLASVDTSSARDAVISWIDKAPARRPAPGYVLRRVGRRGAKVNAAAMGKAIAKALPKSKQARALLMVAWHGRLEACAEAARKHLKAREPRARALALCVAGLGKESLTYKDVKSAITFKEDVVRYAAATAYLGAAKDQRAALDHVLRSKFENVALIGVRFASDHKREDAVPALLALAKGETDAKKQMLARAAACVALGRLGRGKVYDDLAELSRDRAWQVSAAALEGIFFCWRKEAIPHYIEFFSDRHRVVRKVARTNLAYMTRQTHDRRAPYEAWWAKVGGKFELVHPEDVIKKAEVERDKYGYAINTKKHIQKILSGTEIIVVRGRWDFVEKVLVELDVKHTAIFAQKVKEEGLTPKQIVLVNCEGTTDTLTAEYLRWFVVTGGYMATTDWALVNALTRTFPTVISKSAKQNTGNVNVIVEPGLPGSRLLEGAFPFGVRPKWWLEIQAFPIVINDPIRADVLVDSFEMLSRYGSSPMLVEFPAGLGKVIHSTSHFFLAKEGFSNFGSAAERRLFAADHLGLSMKQIRELDAKRFFDQMKDTAPISRNYSMFVMLVNFIREKQAIDLKLR